MTVAIAFRFERLNRLTDQFVSLITKHRFDFLVHPNDPAFDIRWPISQGIAILARDAAYPDFSREDYERQLSAVPAGPRGS